MKPLLLAMLSSSLAVGGYSAGLRWNATPSMPVGIWRVVPLQGPPARHQAVAVCLPEAAARLGRERGYLDSGDCTGQAETLIKPVAAIPGDQVSVSDDGISINGNPVADSKPLPRDDIGRPLRSTEKGVHVVGTNEVWIISSRDPRSYDSRYFGGVGLAGIRGAAMPVFVNK
nr:conjugative transfer signal peptidase TraF [uncultured Rhodopila sp.]